MIARMDEVDAVFEQVEGMLDTAVVVNEHRATHASGFELSLDGRQASLRTNNDNALGICASDYTQTSPTSLLAILPCFCGYRAFFISSSRCTSPMNLKILVYRSEGMGICLGDIAVRVWIPTVGFRKGVHWPSRWVESQYRS